MPISLNFFTTCRYEVSLETKLSEKKVPSSSENCSTMRENSAAEIGLVGADPARAIPSGLSTATIAKQSERIVLREAGDLLKVIGFIRRRLFQVVYRTRAL